MEIFKSIYLIYLIYQLKFWFCSSVHDYEYRYQLGNYFVDIYLFIDQSPYPQIKISALNSENDNKIVYESPLNIPFLIVGNGTVTHPPILNGNYQLHESSTMLTDNMEILHIIGNTTSNEVTIQGNLLNYDIDGFVFDFTLIIALEDHSSLKTLSSTSDHLIQIVFKVNVTSYPSNIIHDESSLIPRLYFYAKSHVNESFYGMGESFTYFNLKGKRIPIVVSEQGVGRGLEPITSYLNVNSSEGVGGNEFTTYSPKALYITNMNHSMMLNNSEIMFINLTNPNIVEFEIWSTNAVIYNFFGNSWIELLESITSVIGRQQGKLPTWSQSGAVIGLEGGTKNVSEIVSNLIKYNVSIGGIWLQDWVGLRHSYDGDRLIWNWELNNDWYPNWNDMILDWKTNHNINVLTYISPFFSNPVNFTNQYRHNFFEQGISNGYFVKKQDDSPYKMYSLSIEFCMLDPTNPFAVDWMSNILKNFTFLEASSSGMMADFGEYLPFDAKLYSGIEASKYHNMYPQEWAKVAMNSVNKLGNQSADILFFMRSSWLYSPPYTPVFWLGDQLTSWDNYDGLKSALTGALSSGLTGQTLTHSDIGGYNVELNLSPDKYYIRTPELLKRWTEFAAFGSALFRTHIGSSTNPIVSQIYNTNSSILHFAKFSRIYGNLSSYRTQLITEASSYGVPIMRPLALHYFYDEGIWSEKFNQYEINTQCQYLFGEDFMIIPSLNEGIDVVNGYLPSFSGVWIHLWSGNAVDLTTEELGKWINDIPASIGYPCVFYKNSSKYGHQLFEFVSHNGYADGYQWNLNPETEKATDSLFTFIVSISITSLLLFLIILYFMVIVVKRIFDNHASPNAFDSKVYKLIDNGESLNS